MTKTWMLSGLAAALLAVAGWLGWGMASGGGQTALETGLVKYICTESRELFESAAEPLPAKNPKTGRRTLMPAVYSEKSQTWHPAATDELQRQARRSKS